MNCCAEVRAIIAASTDVCDAAPAACAGDCATLVSVFATTPLPPLYPNGLADYGVHACCNPPHAQPNARRARACFVSVCTAFPDDAARTDTLLVALISLAVTIPVTAFLASCFEVANDSEAPESWLEWSGMARLLVGRQANRSWNYADGQPARLVRWWIRSSSAPTIEKLVNAAHMLLAQLTCSQPPWARGGKEEEGEEEASSAHELLSKKRAYTAMGLIGLYFVWAVFVWRVATHAAHAFCA